MKSWPRLSVEAPSNPGYSMILTYLHHDSLHTLNLPPTTDVKRDSAYLLTSILAAGGTGNP